MEERRRFPRLRCSSPVQYRSVLNPQEGFGGSMCRDLSISGVQMRAPAFLPLESRLVLLLSLPASLKPIRVVARVVWVREAPVASLHECGLQFLEISPEDREAIAAYIGQGIPTAS